MKSKKFFAIIFLIPLIFAIYFGFLSSKVNDLYPATGVITDISDDVVTYEDFNGFKWQFYGAEDFSIGDVVSVMMNDNNTPEIFDDEIVKVRYSGYIG